MYLSLISAKIHWLNFVKAAFKKKIDFPLSFPQTYFNDQFLYTF